MHYSATHIARFRRFQNQQRKTRSFLVLRRCSTTVVLKLWYARAFQVVREQLSCHIRKALLIRFCVIIRPCVMLMLLIRLRAIFILSTFEQITFF